MATSRNSDTLALVVDGNVTSRSLLSAQLRDYGVTKVVQCSRVQDARIRLEHTVFDYVLCDQYFHDTQSTGQTLLDDLRRAQLLPFSTVFFMEGLAKFKTATWRKHFGAQYLSTLRLSGRMRSAIASIPPWVTRSAP
ncbi:MAG: hypothetical protein L6Q63_07880, partial [Giesbergeria sp.]|nr:hypothetical protein [Giesbergeria sp.]